MRSAVSLAGERSCRVNKAMFLGLTGAVLLVTGCPLSQHVPSATVSGMVVDAETLRPLEHVRVSWSDVATTTDQAGRYSIDLPMGVRKLTYEASERPTVWKAVVLRDDATFDAVLPLVQERPSLVAERSDARDEDSAELWPSEFGRDWGWTLVDAYGNDARSLGMGASIAHGAVSWHEPDALHVAVAPAIIPSESEHLVGIYRYQLATDKETQVVAALVPNIWQLAASADGRLAAAALGYGLHVVDGDTLRKIELDIGEQDVESVAWGPDGRVYFGFEELIPATEWPGLTAAEQAGYADRPGAHFAKQTIGTVDGDGRAVDLAWAVSDEYNYWSPFVPAGSDEIYYCRESIRFEGLELRARRPGQSEEQSRKVADGICYHIRIDSRQKRVFYRQGHEVRLRDLVSGLDLVLLNGTIRATFRGGLPTN